MKLTRYTDYALRVLMYLGAENDTPATISDIATAHGISRNHVMKVVYELSQSGYILTTRGKGGGIRLARPPADINVGTLVRTTEKNLEIAECFGSNNSCPITSACVLRKAFTHALEAFLAVLDDYWLTDLLAPRSELQRLLSI